MSEAVRGSRHPSTTRPPATLSAASQTPLSDDDRDILAGISVMVLAIANCQNLVDQAQPEQGHVQWTVHLTRYAASNSITSSLTPSMTNIG